MKAFAVAALAFAVLAGGCGVAGRDDTTTSAAQAARDWVPPSQERAADGGELYVSAGCVGCHSTDGSHGGGRTFLGLADGRTTEADIARAIRHHRPALHRALSAPQVRALAEFITMIGPTTPGATAP